VHDETIIGCPPWFVTVCRTLIRIRGAVLARHRCFLVLSNGCVVTLPTEMQPWLRAQCAEYRFEVGGIFQPDSTHASWPLIATSADELSSRLAANGHLLPLPKEPAALANIMEVSLVSFLTSRLSALPGAEFERGTERGYPDLEIFGAAFGGGFHAIDIKAARRAPNGRRTQSRITLYTGNTYFRWPQLHWPGTFRSFNEYTAHLDILMIYTLDQESSARVRDLELIVAEPWRIASRERSSTTREYIGAVDDIAALRSGAGAFATAAEFYEYWRRYSFKVSPQVQRQLAGLLESTQIELASLRARQSGQS
jgi:hypothetical protein